MGELTLSSHSINALCGITKESIFIQLVTLERQLKESSVVSTLHTGENLHSTYAVGP